MKSLYPSPPERLSKKSVGWLVEQIKEAIRARRYAPGQRLIEADLTSEYNLRRGPVREALRILAGDGIIELVPQKGARVRRLGTSDMRDLVPILGALLRLTVQLTLKASPSSEQLTKLEQAMQTMRSAADGKNMDRFRLAGLEYTKILRAVAANRYLDYLEGKLHADLFYAQAGALTPVDDWPSHLLSFEQLHVAISNSDLSGAMKVLDEQERSYLDQLDS